MIATARVAAFDALREIEARHLDLGEAVARVRKPLADERDRALLLELVSGTLRMRAAIDFQLASRVIRSLSKLDEAVRIILRMSGFQLLYLSRIPASAVINDAVELTRRSGKSSAAGLVNAVLRALARDREKLTWPAVPPPDAAVGPVAEYLAVVHSHPAWLVARWVERHGRDAAERWLEFNNHAAALCLAPNRTLVSRDALAEELLADGVETRPTSRAPHGLHVVSGQPLATRAFREGRFLVQDEASQLIAALVDPPRGSRVLDLCASPGGKTMSLVADVGGQGLVVASDVRPHRLRVLASTLARCCASRARVIQVPAEGPLPLRDESVDAVLIDAPCSGLGTVRRDPDIRWRRSPEDLPRFAAAQLNLLDRACGLVRPGGTLIYSTCSSEPDENEDVVAAFLRTHANYSQVRTHQTLPFRDGLEAFYGAVLRRTL
ncbi:MAG: 16S rRNA (cytosine(967)-C(5))-methyltransferase RsmB [Acidobacteriota bacterium]|nr:16S rRNA (cytosine(967)-C(5))-methyltransferase RsmB [Acidobacteriota bacterium]